MANSTTDNQTRNPAPNLPSTGGGSDLIGQLGGWLSSGGNAILNSADQAAGYVQFPFLWAYNDAKNFLTGGGDNKAAAAVKAGTSANQPSSDLFMMPNGQVAQALLPNVQTQPSGLQMGGPTPSADLYTLPNGQVATDLFGGYVPPALQQLNAYNPLAMQLYFTQAVGPLLAQIQGTQQSQMNELYGKAGGIVNHVALPPGVQAIMGNNMSNNKAAAMNLNNALAAASVAGPSLDRLMENINRDYQENVKAYLAAQALASAGGTTSTGGLTAQDKADISALFKQGK